MPSATVRLLCEARSQSRTVRDASTAERPFYWRGSSVNFQLALTDQGAFLLAAGIGTIIVEVKRLNALALDDALMRKEYVAADCDETFASADWPAGTKALLTASFTVNEAAILPGTYRLIVRHLGTGEDEGTELVHLSTELQVLDPQSGSVGIDPPPAAWTFLDQWPVIRHDTGQDLSPTQQAQALANIGAGPLILDAPPSNGTITGMLVSAPGTDHDGTYTENGTLNGKPKYEKGSPSVTHYLAYETTGAPDRWKFFNGAPPGPDFSPYKAAGGNEARPDLATDWTDVTDTPVAITITPIISGGTAGIVGQFAIHGTRVWQCIAPATWQEMLPALDLSGTDKAGITAPLTDGKRHLALWNETLELFRGFRLTGDPLTSSETWEAYDLPT